MPFCSSRIYTNITIEIFVKVNIPPRSNKVGNDLDTPLPGLQNDKNLQYSVGTNVMSKESSALYYTFHK